MEGFFYVFKMLIAFIMVIFIACISLRFLQKKASGRKRFINIIEKTALGSNSFLSIVKVADEYFLMSFTGKDVKILKKLNSEALGDIKAEDTNMENKPDMFHGLADYLCCIGTIKDKFRNEG